MNSGGRKIFRFVSWITVRRIFHCAVQEIVLYLMQYMALGINVEIFEFAKILLVEVIYNILLIIILYLVSVTFVL